MANKSAKKTSICGYDADNIVVRDKDLVNELIGQLNFTEMLLYQMLGQMPSAAQVAIVDAVMVTIMEHGLIPSAITARMTLYGAPESLQGAVAAGLLGVGDRFAGTASETAKLLERVVAAPEPERETVARQLVKELRQQKQPVPGFGHPVHKQADPRVARLLEVAQSTNTNGEYIHAMYLIETALEQELGKKLPTNISAAIAAVLCEAGVPAKIMRGIVLTARCAGLVGHLLEEMDFPAADAMWDAVQAAVPFEKP